MADWQPASYLMFGRERTQPAIDLVSRIEASRVERILDVGCGPGNSTSVLRSRWPNAIITGIDSSPEMIAKARASYPGGRWVLADFLHWKPGGKYNILFSNATLHWLPNHEALIPILFQMVDESGVLAIQIPAINDSPVHQAARHIAEKDEWKETLAGCGDALTCHPEAFYYQHLSEHSRRVELWHTIYYHIMNDHQHIMQWYSSTGLKVYLSRLSQDSRKERFKSQVLEACSGNYPVLHNGKILFPFKRLFMIAYR